jgi:hypothetical protein
MALAAAPRGAQARSSTAAHGTTARSRSSRPLRGPHSCAAADSAPVPAARGTARVGGGAAAAAWAQPAQPRHGAGTALNGARARLQSRRAGVRAAPRGVLMAARQERVPRRGRAQSWRRCGGSPRPDGSQAWPRPRPRGGRGTHPSPGGGANPSRGPGVGMGAADLSPAWSQPRLVAMAAQARCPDASARESPGGAGRLGTTP